MYSSEVPGTHLTKEQLYADLKEETEVILDTEKKKLEAKKNKLQKEIETLKELKIIYKLTGGEEDAWKDGPMLSYRDILNEWLARKGKISIDEEKWKTVQNLTEKLPKSAQMKTIFELPIKEKRRRKPMLWKNNVQSSQQETPTVEQQLKTKDDEINSLKRKNEILRQRSIPPPIQNVKARVHYPFGGIKMELQHRTTTESFEIQSLRSQIRELQQSLADERRKNAVLQRNRASMQRNTQIPTTTESTQIQSLKSQIWRLKQALADRNRVPTTVRGTTFQDTNFFNH
ncbi:hypothetical protein K501DRAFT_277912 [Backusella circina FSU 941]|nr:hypothetical protein K501DRAFT_277912 [Backusella circina FSU 941]